MRFTRSTLATLLVLGGVVGVVVVGGPLACGSVPDETLASQGGREVAPAGILKGSVVYAGPHPCSSNGHIVGGAILFVFDRRNPPPPAGVATTPINFAVVPGDALFADEPRNPGPSTYCPSASDPTATLTVSAPFTISPLAAGSYVIQSFYDFTGDFLPTFKFRDLPEMGDIGGGVVDTADALEAINAGNPNYQPHFLPVDVGTPLPLDGGPDAEIPNFVLPDTGVVVDGLTVTLGSDLPMARPYFYPAGLQVSFDPSSGALTTSEAQSSATAPTSLTNIRNTTEKNPNFDPILTLPQDIAVLAPPVDSSDMGSVNNFESKFPHLVLHAGVPAAELPPALAQPFHFQLSSAAPAGFTVWQNALFDAPSQKWVAEDIPEGGGIPSLWPLVVLTKLIDDPTHTLDPSSILGQGSASAPVVILQGITLLGGNGSRTPEPDSIFDTAEAEAFGLLFDPVAGQPKLFPQDHLTVLLRPAAICFDTLFDPTQPDKRGTLVTPHELAATADLTNPQAGAPIIPLAALSTPALAALVDASKTTEACLPTGRYAINVVYPDGQAWTVPNESGACSGAEGATDYTKLSCTLQPRPILRSQGTRAVVEIVPATDPSHCAGAMAVPAPCSVHAPSP